MAERPSEHRPENHWIVVTTINRPSSAMRTLSQQPGWSLVVVGDEKTPGDWELDGAHYLSLETQRELFGELADLLPLSHYCRKNLGYLYAASRGATAILDTDDDNSPYPGRSVVPGSVVEGRMVDADGWVNVYQYFTDQRIWPRGLPLDEIQSLGTQGGVARANCPVQQFLADEDPDVDAVYRLVLGEACVFREDDPVILQPGAWCPFNSQNTLFLREAFPLLYLPSYVSFRMTDIWRSFVAQQSLWVRGACVAFRSATAVQDRNPHDLMSDFAQEVPGYLRNREIVDALAETAASLSPTEAGSLSATAFALWKRLRTMDVIPEAEMPILERWSEMMQGEVGSTTPAG